MEKVSAERVLELLKATLKVSASEGTAHCGYSEIQEKAIREFAISTLEDIESYENGYCDHLDSETVNVPGTDETITICHYCGKEL